MNLTLRNPQYLEKYNRKGFMTFSSSESQDVLVDRNLKIRFVVRGGATLAHKEDIGSTLTYLGPDTDSYIAFNVNSTTASGGMSYPVFDAMHVMEKHTPEILVTTYGDPWRDFDYKYWSTHQGKDQKVFIS